VCQKISTVLGHQVDVTQARVGIEYDLFDLRPERGIIVRPEVRDVIGRLESQDIIIVGGHDV
jgi:hypothetical protein